MLLETDGISRCAVNIDNLPGAENRASAIAAILQAIGATSGGPGEPAAWSSAAELGLYNAESVERHLRNQICNSYRVPMIYQEIRYGMAGTPELERAGPGWERCMDQQRLRVRAARETLD
eukprot:11227253-Lingulodinium_polyedra.AAC.1